MKHYFKNSGVEFDGFVKYDDNQNAYLFTGVAFLSQDIYKRFQCSIDFDFAHQEVRVSIKNLAEAKILERFLFRLRKAIANERFLETLEMTTT